MNKTILLFTDWYEPAFKAGGPIQSCRKIVSSFSEDYKFFIITSDRDLGDIKPFSGIELNKWISAGTNVQICYASTSWLSFSRIRQLVRQVGPSIVYFNSLFSANFTLKPLWVLRKINFKGRIILAPRGMLMTSALSEKKWKKKVFLSLLSFTSFSKRIIFHATNEKEKQAILTYLGNESTVIVAPNIPESAPSQQARIKSAGTLNIVYISRIHPIKNLLFALQALKDVKDCGQVKFDIYGSVDDENYFRKCFEAARQLENRITIHFMGPAEHASVFDILGQYHLFFLPTQGENFGHSIFEALSSGCPVLISDQTPWSDIAFYNAGWAMPLSDINKFSEKVSEVCSMDEEKYNLMSMSAGKYAEQFINSSALKEKYINLFG